MGRHMPDHPSQLRFSQIAEIVGAGRSFDDKAVEVTCLVAPLKAGSGTGGFRMSSARDPEQKLTIRAEIPERLLAELGGDSPAAPGADRKWKYVVTGRLSGDRNGLRLAVESIGRSSKMKKK